MRLGWFVLLSSLLSAQPAVKQIQILIPPSAQVPAAHEGQPGTIQSSLGDQPVKILGPSTIGSPAVIIADLATTPIERHACLLHEIARALPNLDHIPVYSPIDTMRRNFYSVEMATGLHLGLLSSPQLLEKFCQESLRVSEKHPGLDASLYTMSLIPALTHRYAGKGPLRIFWLSTDFRSFDWRSAIRRPSPIEFTKFPSLTEFLAPSLSEASAVLIPVQVRIPQQARSPVQASLESAEYLAAETGGFTASTGKIPGEGLTNAVNQSMQYRSVQVEIPSSVPSTAINPTHLQLGSFRRVHVTKPSADAPTTESAGILVTPFSADFQASAGCEEMPANEVWIRIQPPAPVMKAPSGRLLVHLEALRKEERSLRQRLILDLAKPLCVAVQDSSTQQEQHHLIVIHEESSGWTAAKTINLRQKSQ